MLVKKLFIGLLLFTFFACQTEVPNEIALTLQVDNPDPETEYAIRLSSSFSAEPVVKFKLSEEINSHTVTIPFNESKMFSLRGGFYKSIYAEPGDELVIEVSTNEEGENVFAYKGSAALHQQLIDDFAKMASEFREAHSDLEYRQYSLPWEEYLAAINDINEKKVQMIESTEGVSDTFKAMAKAELWAQNISSKQSFVSYYNFRIKGENDEEMKLTELEDIYTEAFKFDKSALASSTFSSLLSGYVTEQAQKMFADDESEIPWYSRQDTFSEMYHVVEADQSIPAHFKEHALQSFVGSLLMFAGVDIGDEIRKDFVSKYPNNNEVESLNAQYKKWEPLKAGKPALDFTFENVQGDMESLSDYFGNVIYIDVWATWCGPCITEFPSSKELKAKLSGADDVVFMYVSVDDADDKETWKTDLVKHGLAEGVNLFAGEGWESKINELYQIQGIPRYILIDKQGKIYKSQAPRPSSGDLIFNDIQKLRGVNLDRALSMK